MRKVINTIIAIEPTIIPAMTALESPLSLS